MDTELISGTFTPQVAARQVVTAMTVIVIVAAGAVLSSAALDAITQRVLGSHTEEDQ